MKGRFPFNVRVYGLLIENGQVLVADEKVHGQLITKFPGGGLEFGEGPAECIVREWQEELGQKIEVGSHFYTTDFFQRSAFRNEDQVISIYYLVEALTETRIEIRNRPFDHREGEREAFRWQEIASAVQEDLTFPIDRVVLRALQNL